MRSALLALAPALSLSACGAGGATPSRLPADAAFPAPGDADQSFCDAPASSAQVSITTPSGTFTFTRVHAGGTASGGDAAPLLAPAGTLMSLLVELVNETRLSETNAYACAAPGQGCPYDGIVGHVDCIGCDANDLGPHPITLQSLQHDITVVGTLTITSYVPFIYDQHPGHIAGSISTPDATVTGTFENDFCALLLTATI